MKKILLLISIIFLLTGCNNTTSVDDTMNEPEEEKISTNFESDYQEGTIPYSNTVVCKLKMNALAEKHPYEEKLEASAGLESSPMTITITDIDTDKPILVSSDGNRADLFKVPSVGNQNLVYMFEITAVGNLNVWSLFRDYNMLSVTKQYSLGGPFILAMLGDCKAGF